jgi:hypothetical protein
MPEKLMISLNPVDAFPDKGLRLKGTGLLGIISINLPVQKYPAKNPSGGIAV